MGGHGSGVETGKHAKDLVEQTLRIDVADLRRNRQLEPGYIGSYSGVPRGRFAGRIALLTSENKLDLDYEVGGRRLKCTVHLSRTPCNFGGSRVWFHCPVPTCGRRVRVLFGGDVFACRKCAELAYASTRDAAAERHVRRAGRIQRRLRWPEGIFRPFGQRPEGMHLNTYIRLVGDLLRHREAFCRLINDKFRNPN